MGMSLGINRGMALNSGGNTFSPLNWLQSSVGGLWMPSSLTRMSQDQAGTIPVTAAGDPVGLWRGETQESALGPELFTNTGFDSDTDWTKGSGWSIAGGVAVKAAGANSELSQNPTLTANAWHRSHFTIPRYVAGQVRPKVGNVNGTYRAALGTYTEYLLPTSTATSGVQTTGLYNGDVDNVSLAPVVAIIAGTPASQTLKFADGAYYVDNTAGTLTVNLPDLGTDATRVHVTWAGVQFSEGLTINGATALPQDYLFGILYIDRALTNAEKTRLTTWFAGRTYSRLRAENSLRQNAVSRLGTRTGTIRYVDPAATGAANGTSWTDAYTTLAAAVSAASAGDTIYTNATFAAPLRKEAIATNMTRIEIVTDQGAAGHTWVDGRNTGTFTDAGGGVFSRAVATEPEFVSYDLKQDDAAGTVTGINIADTTAGEHTGKSIADYVAQNAVSTSLAAAWYGFLPKAAVATTTPADGEWSWVSGTLYVNPPGSPVLATVNSLTAWSTTASAWVFSGTQVDCYIHGDLRTFFCPATDGPDGYGIRMTGALRCTIADHKAIIAGYHAAGMVSSSQGGNTLINCHCYGHTATASGTGVANPWVFFCQTGDHDNFNAHGCFFLAYPLLRTTGAPLSTSFTPALGYSHSGGGVMDRILWNYPVQIDFVGQIEAKHSITMTYGGNTGRSVTEANIPPVSIDDAGTWGCVVRNGAFIGKAGFPGLDVEWFYTDFDRMGYGATTEFLSVLSTAGGMFSLRMTGGSLALGDFDGVFQAMQSGDAIKLDGVTVDMQTTTDAYLFNVTATGARIVIKNSTFLTDLATNSLLQTTNPLFNSYPDFIESQGGNRYHSVFTDRFVRAASLASGQDTVAEYLALVDPDGNDTGNYTP
jgi:hypothetical protein